MNNTPKTTPLSSIKIYRIASDVLRGYKNIHNHAASGNVRSRRKLEQLMLECHSKLLELARDASRKEAESCRSREHAWADYEPM